MQNIHRVLLIKESLNLFLSKMERKEEKEKEKVGMGLGRGGDDNESGKDE